MMKQNAEVALFDLVVDREAHWRGISTRGISLPDRKDEVPDDSIWIGHSQDTDAELSKHLSWFSQAGCVI